MDWFSEHVLPQLTVAGFVSSAFLSGTLTLLLWVVMWSFNNPPKRARLFFVAVSLALFIVVVSLSTAVRRTPPPPDLKIDFQAEYYEFSTQSPTFEKSVFVVLSVLVRNLGEPSSVYGYGLESIVPGAKTIRADRQLIPMRGLPMPRRGNRELEWLCGADALETRTVSPIPRGGIATGRLLFMFKGVDLSRVALPSGHLKLTVVDVYGRVHTAESTESGLAETRAYPGIAARPIQPMPTPPKGEVQTPTVKVPSPCVAQLP